MILELRREIFVFNHSLIIIKKLNQLSSQQNDIFLFIIKLLKIQRNQNPSTEYFSSKTNLDKGFIMNYSNIKSIKNEKINNVN